MSVFVMGWGRFGLVTTAGLDLAFQVLAGVGVRVVR